MYNANAVISEREQFEKTENSQIKEKVFLYILVGLFLQSMQYLMSL